MARSEDITLALPAGECDAVVARPGSPTGGVSGEGSGARSGEAVAYPPVLLIMDAIGVRPRIVDMAARIADLGYVVLAPNVFHRAGRQPLVDPALLVPARYDERVARFHELFAHLTDADWDADGPAYLAAVRDLAGAPADEPVRVVGYCMGGRLGIRLAARCGGVACVAAFHPGQLVTDTSASPHRLLHDVPCPVVLGYADDDPSMTPEQQGVLARAAADAHVDFTGFTNPGAAHGYTMADMPAFHPEATERAFAHTRALFGRC